MKTTVQFLDKMYEIEQELQNLSHQYADLYQEYEGKDFENQNGIAADFENAVLAITHEMASFH